jgi:hypothetical protein
VCEDFSGAKFPYATPSGDSIDARTFVQVTFFLPLSGASTFGKSHASVRKKEGRGVYGCE